MADRDHVEVAAGALIRYRLVGYDRGMEPSMDGAYVTYADAVALARTEATRAGEAMREAAAKVADAVGADLKEGIGEWRYAPVDIAASIRALPLSDAPASPWPKDLDIGAAEAALSEVLSGYDYEMPADGMRRVIAAALRLPTPPAKDETA